MATYNALETMKTIPFGIEIETVGISRLKAAEIVQSVVGGTIRHIPRFYDSRIVTAPDGREWTIMRDVSITDGGAEVVSPICKYEDIETIQEIARALRAGGAKIDNSCGIHIHLNAGSFTPAGLARLAKNVYSQEELIVKALKSEDRVAAGRWCRSMDENFIERLCGASTPQSLDVISNLWYNGNASYRSQIHYDDSRYHGLNFHSVFYRGTVEFRYFVGSLHAGKIKSYIQLCLALGAKAINSRGAKAKKRTFNPNNPKYAFRVFLIQLGLNGPEFKTLRVHLMNHLAGNASYAGDRPAYRPAYRPAAAAQ